MKKKNFCESCGKSGNNIRKNIRRQKERNGEYGRKTWNGHEMSDEYSYDFKNCGPNVIYCENCGEKLDEMRDYYTEQNLIGDPYKYETILLGYDCSSCGHSERY